MMKSAILILLMAMAQCLLAQEKAIPIHVSVFNEATAIPFSKFFTLPIHPGLQVGTEFNYKATAHSRLFQTANLSYFYHAQLNQGIALSSELGYEYRLRMGLAFSGLVGIGYLHTLATTKEYVLQNGQYTEKSDRGNARLYPSLSLDLGYYLRKDDARSPKIFLRYQAWAEYPYSPGFIPVMTHINLHVGAKFMLPTAQKADENL
jgi:hypothetical protein